MNSKETLYRTTRVIWYLFYVIETLLLLRFVLKLLGANSGAAFTQIIYSTSEIFVAPFLYVFGSPSAGGSMIELSTILAMIVYWLGVWGIIKLIVMNRQVDTYEAEASLEEQDNV